MIVLLVGLRVLVLALAAYNCAWTAPTMLDVFRGRWSVRHLIGSMIFFFSAAQVALQSFFVLFGMPVGGDAWRAMSLALAVVALVLAAQWRRPARHFARFARVFDQLDAALAIADLATIDPEAGRAQAEHCRRLAAKALRQ